MDNRTVTKRVTEQTGSPAVEHTAAAKKNWPTKVQKYQTADMKFGFAAIKKNDHNSQHVS